ncbi:MAG: PilN domain-containing protein [Bryobacteraceae bacterium]
MTPTEQSSGDLPGTPAPETAAPSSARDTLRKWLAFGSGVGIEIGAHDLRVVVARVRPSGIRVLGTATIAGFRDEPASAWGAEYAAFLRKLGASHLAAAVLLPRREVIVRQISLPGVNDRDLDSAVRLQLDTLHPFPEEDVVADWTRIGKGGAVLVGIARRSALERYSSLAAEAGVKVATMTFSAAALYSAVHLLGGPPGNGFLAVSERNGELEVYGESPSSPVFSAAFDPPAGRAAAMARAELRLEEQGDSVQLQDVLPAPVAAPENFDRNLTAFAYAAALSNACPRLALRVNLLPPEQRESSSRAMFIPTLVLVGVALLMAGAVTGYSVLANRRYLRSLEAGIAHLEPVAKRSAALDRAIDTAEKRTVMLDDVRRRSKTDLDALNELTRLLPPPTWVNSLELTRASLRISGESDQAAGLLKVLDSSPYFENSQFTISLTRVAAGETFAIRSDRKGAPK